MKKQTKKTSKKKTSKKTDTSQPAPGTAVSPGVVSSMLDYTYEGLVLVEFANGNPAGYFNDGGNPYQCPTTMCTALPATAYKRKMRDWWLEAFECRDGYDVMIRSGAYLQRSDGEIFTLEDMLQRARSAVGLEYNRAYLKNLAGDLAAKTKKEDELRDAQKLTIEAEFNRQCVDRRTLGYVDMTGNDKLFSAKGPFVVHDGESVHPVVPVLQTSTRQMVTSEKERDKRNKSVANRMVLQYALIQTMFTVTPAAAKITGMTMEDLRLALAAMVNCWTLDAAPHRRGVFRGIWMFKCPRLGRRPVGLDWNDVVEVRCKLDDPSEATKYSDFEVIVHEDLIPDGVELLDTEAVLDFVGDLDDLIGVPEAAE